MLFLNVVCFDYYYYWGFPCGSAGEESACNAGDQGWIPGEQKGNPLWHSGLENTMDCIVHGVAKSRTRLSSFRYFYWQY